MLVHAYKHTHVHSISCKKLVIRRKMSPHNVHYAPSPPSPSTTITIFGHYKLPASPTESKTAPMMRTVPLMKKVKIPYDCISYGRNNYNNDNNNSTVMKSA